MSQTTKEAIAIFAIKEGKSVRVYNTKLGQFPVRAYDFSLRDFTRSHVEYNEEIRRIAHWVKETYGCERKVIEMAGKTFVLFHTKRVSRRDIDFLMCAVALQLGI